MLERFRSPWTRLITPIARALLARRISPGMLTWTGTILAVITAVSCFPQGWLWQGSVLLAVLTGFDSLDGTMARLGGQTSQWGAFLDSTLDRISDGAILGSLTWWLAYSEYPPLATGLGITAVVFAEVTSYAKARGEILGAAVSGGLFTRADRVLIALLGGLAEGLGFAWALPAVMGLLSLGGAVTVAQRMITVRGVLMERHR